MTGAPLLLLVVVVTFLLPGSVLPAGCSCTLPGPSVTCTGTNSSSVLISLPATITSLALSDCSLACLPWSALASLPRLASLTVTRCGLTSLQCPAPAPPLPRPLLALTALDLSHNQLGSLDPSLALLPSLASLNLSSNQLTTLGDGILSRLTTLSSLDLSHNQMGASLVRSELPSQLARVRLEGNPWPCSPGLAWLAPWAATLATPGLGPARCSVTDSRKTAPLLGVMKLYNQARTPHLKINDLVLLSSARQDV